MAAVSILTNSLRSNCDPLIPKVAKKKQAPRKVVKGKGVKGGKKKKLQLKFTIDCSRPVEDGIMVANDFVS